MLDESAVIPKLLCVEVIMMTQELSPTGHKIAWQQAFLGKSGSAISCFWPKFTYLLTKMKFLQLQVHMGNFHGPVLGKHCKTGEPDCRYGLWGKTLETLQTTLNHVFVCVYVRERRWMWNKLGKSRSRSPPSRVYGARETEGKDKQR